MSTTDKPASAQVLAFTVEQPELLAALTFAAKALPKRPNVPVLTGVVLTGDGQRVTVETFDYEQARTVVLPGASCARPGSVLVAASKLTERVKALPKGRPVTLTGEGATVRLSNGKTTYTIPTMPIEDYPARPDMPPTVGMIDGSVLAGQVAQVAKFVCTDETLPVMTGIRVSAQDGRLSLEATDRYRLGVRDVDWAPEVDKFAALVSGKLFSEVTKALGKSPNAVVTLGYANASHEGMFGIETAHVRVITRTLDSGAYPPVRSLIPKHPVLEVDVDASALVEAIKRVEVAAERTTPVSMRFADDAITLACGTADDGDASEEFDGCTFVTETDKARAVTKLAKEAEAQARKQYARDSKDVRDSMVAQAGRRVRDEFEHATGMSVGANPRYLRDVLDLGTPRVRMQFVSPFKPFVILPLDTDGVPVAGVTNLLMPIRITGGPETPPVRAASDVAEAAPVTVPEPDGATASGSGSGGAAPAAPAVQQRPAGTNAASTEPPRAAAVVAPATGQAVLDPNEEHLFQRAVEDGKKPNPFTKCACGRIRNAKVHGGKSAAAKAAAAARAAGQPDPAPAVPQGPIWMAVLQLAARVDGRMVTEATEEGARKAVEQFGRSLDVLVSADESGKRMYVAARSEKDADLMQRVACAFGIPAHTAQGVWPPQGEAAVSVQDGARERAPEQSPVITDGEPTFDPRATSVEAFTKVGTGDFEGALTLIRTAMQVAPEHRFHDKATSRMYGWAEIERAILAKQVEAEINAEAERDALAAVTAASPAKAGDVEAGPDAGDDDPDVEVDEPQVPATAAGADTGRSGAVRSASNTVIVRLREALAGQPDDVIEAAVAAAMAKMQAKPVAATSAPRPREAAATVTPPTTTAFPVVAVPPLARAKRFPAPVGDVARWEALGMLAPSTLAGERVFVLLPGTRVRALRKAVLDALGEAKRAGTIAATPSVEADKSERPYRLRVRFTDPGALTAASALADDAVAAALPDVLPVRANA